jgi:hypothetical protein
MTAVALQKKSSRSIFKVENTASQSTKYGFVDKDGVYNLSDFELEKLKRADEQLANGQFITQDKMDLKVGAWLNEE